jgi:ABC-type polysaccharide/polyol phosphate export permease
LQTTDGRRAAARHQFNLAQQLSLANPLLYLVNAFRWSFLGRSDVSFAMALAVICGLGLILVVVALKLRTPEDH